MRDDLFLRPTVIGDDTTPDDYQVVWNDLPIGRVLAGRVGGPT
jgi:hypothetical protein